ncbi:PhzF family phenazine biosynthesis protein [Siculibacillus lacustris]|uniref:PhzF family phenazine biosynthesis protein n=1 Tax=Siculibacillus lacustris TaxID=1549641 RepID=A0A4Q9VKF5_9HYPH|nr:PhzF family phenazine biosynthesis protein [Siculibacillus lacustris]TBW35385.1 PhzF family phenazine biosynthesis protein [Siculibacillus lacustris]
MPRRYVLLDVFTSHALEGNPLAVVLDAEGLDGVAMQRIAREFNLSETVFVLPAERPSHSAALRIFTPGREMPFAGHPTVGATALLALERFGAVETAIDSMVVVEEPIGVVRAAVRLDPVKAPFAEFDLPRLPRALGREMPSKGLLADALGLDATEIGFENHVPVAFEAGVPFAFVPVAGLDAIGRVATDRARLAAAFGRGEPLPVYVYCRESVRHDSAFHARMFDVDFGIGEDPATGAAVAAFAGAIVRFDAPTDGTHRIRIEQGFEMGRPSLIDLALDMDEGALVAARIGGSVVKLAEGVLHVD